MDSIIRRFALGLAGLLASMTAAIAHPHVFVTMKTELVYAANGTITGLRHAWTFDDMFSAFATQGLDQKTKGVFTREELAPLAEINVTSLKEYNFFTNALADGKKAEFVEPKDYWLDFKDDVLTLNFTLPLKAPLRVKALEFEVFDPAYFVDFNFAKDNPVTLSGASGTCKANVVRPQDSGAAPGRPLSESLFNQPGAGNFGAQFANKIAVRC